MVLTPIGSITRGDEVVKFESSDTLLGLRKNIVDIQTGAAPDRHGWLLDV